MSDFPAEDRLILRSTAERAAAFIAQKRVADERELFLHVLIVNLVNNAFAYGDPSTPVDLNVEGEDGCVVLRVHNEGEPIPAEVRAHLFEAFRGSPRAWVVL
jgi:signal transduction histidine kinase